MREGKTERKIDAIEKQALANIDTVYGKALSGVLKKHKADLKQLKALMDGTAKAPCYCFTDTLKEGWRRKEAEKLLYSSRIADDLLAALQEAGAEAVGSIQMMGMKIYNTAYSGTMESLGE